MLRVTLYNLGLVLVTILIAAALLPGPQHALWPGAVGLKPILYNTYSDAKRPLSLVQVEAGAVATVEAFFAPIASNPRVIICTTDRCTDKFIWSDGPRPRGLAYGSALIIVTPGDDTQMILTHELVHAELRYRAGRSKHTSAPFPAWFDEGLATWLSQDHRLAVATPAQMTQVAQAQNLADWSQVVQDLGWRTAYGAAEQLLQTYVDQQGRAGLRELIQKVSEGAAFKEQFWRAVSISE